MVQVEHHGARSGFTALVRILPQRELRPEMPSQLKVSTS
jgi:hypothetical protein